MSISSLKILGYRGFADEQTLRISKPTGQPGSGLTVIVGANNTGKSAVIEALNFLRMQSRVVPLSEGQRNAKTNGKTRILYNTKAGDLTLSADGATDAEWSRSHDSVSLRSPYVLQSRRSFDTQFQPTALSREQYLANPGESGQRVSYSNGNFGARLLAISKNQQKYKEVLARVLPDPPDWYVEKNLQGQNFIKVTGASASHSGEGLGSGVLSLLFIIDALYDSGEDELIVIDEPELSLHPVAQRRLAGLLAEYAATRQIIVSTHSPFFSSFEYLCKGGTIARVSQKNRDSVIAQLSDDSIGKVKPLLGDRNNPHILGLDARHAFFLEENVVLVEGQQDVMAYPEIFSSLDINIPVDFFGWGVGGAGNMSLIATLLQELGFQRVAGILDSDQAELRNELGKAFPNYVFMTIPAPDVRTRESRSIPERIGLLDRQGELRVEHQTAMMQIGFELRNYFGARHLAS